MQDLGTVSGDVASGGISINDGGSVVGVSLDANFNPRAFLWERGAMTDLNTLVAGSSPLYLLTACSINTRGEITGLGLTSSGEIHTYLASPTRTAGAGESTSQGAIAPRILSDDARKLLVQQLRFGRTGARFMERVERAGNLLLSFLTSLRVSAVFLVGVRSEPHAPNKFYEARVGAQ